MVLYAVEDIGDAYEATRAFLFPFSLRRWLKLALVVFFIGGASLGSGFQGNFNVDVPSNQPVGPGFGPGSGASAGPLAGPTGGAAIEQFVPLILALAALAVLLAIAFAVVGSVMEFVFVASLREGDVTVRRYFGRYWAKGLRLLGFRIGLVLLTLAVVAIPVVAVSVAFFDADTGVGGAAVPLLLLVPLLLVFVLLAVLVYGFTTVFVVPIMLFEDRGVLSAWRRFWSVLTAQWKQYLAYVVLELVLSIAVGVAVGLFTALVFVVLAIPFGALGALTVFADGGLADLSLAAIALLGVGALVFALLAFLLTALVQVPVLTYFRYYALFVLGDTDETLDLVPERRRRVREAERRDPPSTDDSSTA